jgi:hypothetical protein
MLEHQYTTHYKTMRASLRNASDHHRMIHPTKPLETTVNSKYSSAESQCCCKEGACWALREPYECTDSLLLSCTALALTTPCQTVINSIHMLITGIRCHRMYRQLGMHHPLLTNCITLNRSLAGAPRAHEKLMR